MTDSSHLAIERSAHDWAELEALRWPRVIGWRAPPSPAGLFGRSEDEVRVVLTATITLGAPTAKGVVVAEERQVPYRIEKVTMFCYGEKEAWFKRLVPS